MNDTPHPKNSKPHSKSSAPQSRAPEHPSRVSREKSQRSTLSSSAQTRLYAARTVTLVLRDKVTLAAAFASQPGYGDLDGRDRAFARLIAATVFRRFGQIQAVLKPMLKSPPPLYPMAVLQTAAAQILFLDTAPHAAVGDAVNVLKSSSKTRGFAGLANAVLRKVATEGKNKAGQVAPSENIPKWLANSWDKAYGKTTLRKMSLQLIKNPPLDISLKDTSPENIKIWSEKLDAEILPTGSLRRERIGDVTALPGFDDGEWWAQDIAASLPVKFMAEAIGDKNGRMDGLKVLDLCAAPGGKTLQAAALGAQVTAVDISQARLGRLSENLSRTQLSADVITADIRTWSPEGDSPEEDAAQYDAVLLDAPCSATGTFRRHPDVLFNKAHTEIGKLAALQDKLLAAAAKHVKPGGTLIFCTCSLQTDEGEARIPAFLEKRPDFCLNPIIETNETAPLKAVTETGYVRTLPHNLIQSDDQSHDQNSGPKSGMDGFFIARLRRQ